MINHDTANKHLDDLTVLLKDPEKKSTDVLDLVCNFSADTTPDKAIKEDDDQTISSSEDNDNVLIKFHTALTIVLLGLMHRHLACSASVVS